MSDPAFRIKLAQAVDSHRELDWIFSNYSYNSNVPLNDTPIINFRNYRYKIVEIFVMTYKQEKAVLDVEIATPDVLLILGTYAEYKLLDRLISLNDVVIQQNHSWNKILALAQGDVRLLVNFSFVVMHLFAGDIVALSDNEIVYCYILAAAVISTIDKSSRARIDKDIQKRGLRRPQVSITDRAAQTSSFGRSNSKIPKDSSKAEAAYIRAFEKILMDPAHHPTNDENRKVQASNLDVFIATAKRLSIRQACLQSLADMGKDLPQLGRLLHLGRTSDAEPKQLFYYIGQDACAMPANALGDHRYKKHDVRRQKML
ncbi:hypothetical protein D0Z03_000865 [Geotrichum reessii]|nr:hypothetical protein D0Z03_000865 [Galactomyces reessii]